MLGVVAVAVVVVVVVVVVVASHILFVFINFINQILINSCNLLILTLVPKLTILP